MRSTSPAPAAPAGARGGPRARPELVNFKKKLKWPGRLEERRVKTHIITLPSDYPSIQVFKIFQVFQDSFQDFQGENVGF